MKFLLLIYLFGISGTASLFESEFRIDYNNALKFVKQNKAEINIICKKFNNNPVIASSVVFPEIIRYSLLKDFFETSALELLYINFGKEYADFSIGRFQMKPSFAEKIENDLQKTDSLKNRYRLLLSYSDYDDKQRRTERLSRLKLLKWQLLYLNCFLDIVKSKFSDSNYQNSELVRIYSAAYNYRYDISSEELMRHSKVKQFPYGGSNMEHQYSYSDISCDFFLNHSNMIFIEN